MKIDPDVEEKARHLAHHIGYCLPPKVIDENALLIAKAIQRERNSHET